jgi:hypothetical protein
MNNTNKYCSAADMPASKRNEKLKCHVPNCSQRAGIGDIVLVSENEAMKPLRQIIFTVVSIV